VILRFRFSNYRSFRDETELTALATRLDTDAAVDEMVSTETHETVKALPVTAILGANASGKSNLIRAINSMQNAVLSSAYPRDRLHSGFRDPFRLVKGGESTPSLFEIDFTSRGSRYLYGFELDSKGVTAEWLHTFPHRRAQLLFDRDGADFSFGRNLPGPNKRISDLTRPDALFLSTAANSNHEFLTDVFAWFHLGLDPVDLSARAGPAGLAREIQGQEKRISRMLRLADLGIVETSIEKGTSDRAERESLRVFIENDMDQGTPDREARIEAILQQLEARLVLRLLHRTDSGVVALPFEEESLGTQTWLLMVVRVLRALDHGAAVVVDELDASLHPALMAEILRMFGDRRANRRGAQLIFTTHDTWTLGTNGDSALSRGQIWFVEKDAGGASSLTPLSDYRPRKGENIERGYLMGRYGGVPRPQSSGIVEVASEGATGAT
jgi:uncharacterized protein